MKRAEDEALAASSRERFALRAPSIGAGDLDALAAALDGGTLSGESAWVGRYERALAARFGAGHAVAVSSGSAALQVALRAAGAVDGAEVLVPATAPLPSLLPILATKAVPVVVDVAPDALGFDPEDLRRRVGPRTRAALAVLLWGYPQDLVSALAVLDPLGVPLIEDACQAHGTTIGGRSAGTIGKIGCFSTHDFKLLSTGEGGFILTDDGGLAREIARYARLGGLDGVHAGLNYKLGALPAALGLHRLAQLDGRLAQQRRNARRLAARLDLRLLTPLPEAGGEPNYYSFVALMNLPGEACSHAARTLAKFGLETDGSRFGYDLVYRRPLFTQLATPCPNAERLVARTLQLPCHPALSEAEIDRIADLVSAAVAGAAPGSVA
ncbi:MAG: perosamine synthetase [Sphingomonadales bacterium]|nr:perosamine synthetase [Sphingomonadales bacterium]